MNVACGKIILTSVCTGLVKCNKCLEVNVIKNGVSIKAVPNVFYTSAEDDVQDAIKENTTR